jgi:hypothetical protein
MRPIQLIKVPKSAQIISLEGINIIQGVHWSVYFLFKRVAFDDLKTSKIMCGQNKIARIYAIKRINLKYITPKVTGRGKYDTNLEN